MPHKEVTRLITATGCTMILTNMGEYEGHKGLVLQMAMGEGEEASFVQVFIDEAPLKALGVGIVMGLGDL